MSETVQIAIITFLSGAVGAICGVIGSHISAKISANAEIQKIALEKYFDARIKAYSNILMALEKLNNDFTNGELRTAIYNQIYIASCVSSDRTRDCLHRFKSSLNNLAKKYDATKCTDLPSDFIKARDAMLQSMHDDLLNFSLPKIKK